ncbi:hypothetical protein VPH35_026250 [Triticum aestivum]
MTFHTYQETLDPTEYDISQLEAWAKGIPCEALNTVAISFKSLGRLPGSSDPQPPRLLSLLSSRLNSTNSSAAGWRILDTNQQPMGTEFYETMLIIKGARAETEDDLSQLFEDFGINGSQLAASFGPPTFVMDSNLTSDAAPVPSPLRVGPSAALTVDLIVPTLELVDEAVLAAPLSPSAYMIEKNLTHDEDPAATLPESVRRCKRGPRKRRIPLCTDQGWFLGDHFGGTSCLRDAPSSSEGRNRGLRTNGPHWTTEEVTALVDGLEEFGGRRWSAIKKKYFPKPDRTDQTDRTTENLKDKWRNLRKSYTGSAERRYYLVLPDHLIQRLKRLAATGN